MFILSNVRRIGNGYVKEKKRFVGDFVCRLRHANRSRVWQYCNTLRENPGFSGAIYQPLGLPTARHDGSDGRKGCSGGAQAQDIHIVASGEHDESLLAGELRIARGQEESGVT